jgi:hypothetical protein
VVYFAVDWDAYKPSDKAIVIEYFKGIDVGAQQAYDHYPHHSDQDTPVFSIGVYGSIYVLNGCRLKILRSTSGRHMRMGGVVARISRLLKAICTRLTTI